MRPMSLAVLLALALPALALAAPDAGPAAVALSSAEEAAAVASVGLPPGVPVDVAGVVALATGPGGVPWFALVGAVLFLAVRALKGQAGVTVPVVSAWLRGLTPAAQAILIAAGSVAVRDQLAWRGVEAQHVVSTMR